MPRRYIIGLIAVALVFIIGTWLLIRWVNGGEDQPEQTSTSVQAPTDEFGDATVLTYTTYGPVVAEENRTGVRITISQSQRKAEILTGYNGAVSKTANFSNTQAAYDALLAALDGAGYDQYDELNKTNPISVCSTGREYRYEADYPNANNLFSWSTSCGAKQGSFQGNASLVRRLMQAQIPNYSDFTSGISL